MLQIKFVFSKVLLTITIFDRLLPVLCSPLGEDSEAKILSYNYETLPDGYVYGYETSNGIYRHERGSFVDDAKGGHELKVEGFYSFTDPDGKFQSVTYESGKEGYVIKTIGLAAGAPQPTFRPRGEAFDDEGTFGTKSISSAALASLGGNG